MLPQKRKPVAPIVKTLLSDQTYEALKEQILDQTLEPGARLNIDGLSRMLNVSSSPIREALARLEAERLVVATVNSGYSVAPSATPEYLSDLHEFRLVIEGYCARVGAESVSADTLALLERSVEKMASMRKLGPRYREYRQYTDWDSTFHQAIVDSANNEVLSTTYRSMHVILLGTRLSLYREAGSIGSDEAAKEHADILDAFKARDGARAEAAIHAHLKGAKRRVFVALEKRKGLANNGARSMDRI